MKLKSHIIASSATSIFYGWYTHSWSGALACFLSGILIDLDHLLDYMVIKKKFWVSHRELDDYCSHNKEGQIFLIFHSYELLCILWALSLVLLRDSVWIGLVFGMTVHMILDQFTNNTYPLAYFLLVRARYGFPHKIFFRREFVEEVIKGGGVAAKS